MAKFDLFRIPMEGPEDTSGLERLLDDGTLKAEEIIAVLAKTEGNGCVNDFTRGYTTLVLKLLLSERLKLSRDQVAGKVAFVMSGGTEGVMTPHMTVFTRTDGAGAGAGDAAPNGAAKRLAVGVAFTRDFGAEEIGRMTQLRAVAHGVRQAMQEAGIENPADVHYVQVKCPLLTADRIEEAHERGAGVVVTDTYKSMGYSRGASALGVALALGEVAEDKLSDDVICNDWNLYSEVASTSAGVELRNCEIILLGNSSGSTSDLMIGHSVMQDAIDSQAVLQAMRHAGLEFSELPGRDQLDRVANVLAKAEASSTGEIRGRRHIMLDDSDINHTRHARAVVNAVIAAMTGDPMSYVSGGAEHQGPDGGGAVAVIARANA